MGSLGCFISDKLHETISQVGLPDDTLPRGQSEVLVHRPTFEHEMEQWVMQAKLGGSPLPTMNYGFFAAHFRPHDKVPMPIIPPSPSADSNGSSNEEDGEDEDEEDDLSDDTDGVHTEHDHESEMAPSDLDEESDFSSVSSSENVA